MPVSQAKIKEIGERLERLGVREADIKEHFVRSSGAGGQNVNKVSSCVVLKHIPTGIEVKCQIDRSQAMNRFYARRILAEKIEQKVLGELSEKEMLIWKKRKQKKKRSKRAKEKMLADKRTHSEKKYLRKRVTGEG